VRSEIPGAPGERRYHWTVTVLGEPDAVAAGRTGELGRARSLGILAMWRAASRPVAGGASLDNGSLARLFWRILDALDYWLTQAMLWFVDAVSEPEPKADRQRAPRKLI
jgi:hypothetical protein